MKIKVHFDELDSNMNIKFIQTECLFNIDFGEIFKIKTDDIYDGEYEVTPRVYEQILETKDKLMLDNVTVNVIPLAMTINLSNGYTATIG